MAYNCNVNDVSEMVEDEHFALHFLNKVLALVPKMMTTMMMSLAARVKKRSLSLIQQDQSKVEVMQRHTKRKDFFKR